MRRTLLAAALILFMIAAPTSSQADAVGAAFGAGTGLLVAGPPGAIVGGVIGAVWGHPFWGPPNSPHACWIDNSFYRHCRYYGGRWITTELFGTAPAPPQPETMYRYAPYCAAYLVV